MPSVRDTARVTGGRPDFTLDSLEERGWLVWKAMRDEAIKNLNKSRLGTKLSERYDGTHGSGYKIRGSMTFHLERIFPEITMMNDAARGAFTAPIGSYLKSSENAVCLNRAAHPPVWFVRDTFNEVKAVAVPIHSGLTHAEKKVTAAEAGEDRDYPVNIRQGEPKPPVEKKPVQSDLFVQRRAEIQQERSKQSEDRVLKAIVALGRPLTANEVTRFHGLKESTAQVYRKAATRLVERGELVVASTAPGRGSPMLYALPEGSTADRRSISSIELVFDALSDKWQTAEEIASRIGRHPSTVHQAIRSLIASELVEKRSRHHKRSFRLAQTSTSPTVTPASAPVEEAPVPVPAPAPAAPSSDGLDLVAAVSAEVDRRVTEALARMDPGEMIRLREENRQLKEQLNALYTSLGLDPKFEL